MRKIYISSTYKDLIPYRSSVIETLRKAKYDVIAMEDYIATAQHSPLEECLNDVRRSDIYVGIFAWRYGYIPETPHNLERRSITELEYREAKKYDKPCLLFLIDGDHPWNPRLLDPKDDSKNNIFSFRDEISKYKLASFFTTAEDLSGKVLASLTSYQSSIAQQSTQSRSSQKIELDYQSINIINISLEQLGDRKFLERLSDSERLKLDEIQLQISDLNAINSRLKSLANSAETVLNNVLKSIDTEFKKLTDRQNKTDIDLQNLVKLARDREVINNINRITSSGKEASLWLERNQKSLIKKVCELIFKRHPKFITNFSEDERESFRWAMKNNLECIEFSLKWCDKEMLENPGQFNISDNVESAIYSEAFQYIRDERIEKGQTNLSQAARSQLLEYVDDFIENLNLS